MFPADLAKKVKAEGADIGIALDGDGDRCILVDENGVEVDGDHVLAICATDMLRKGTLKGNTLVATIMSNSGLETAIEAGGGKVVRTGVGDRYVVEEMLKNDYNLGGEQSGHVIFLDHTTTGDGIITALQILAIMREQGKKLSELASVMTSFPQVLVNVPVKNKKPLDDIDTVSGLLADVQEKLKGRGRAFIRYSGTENLARITVEGEDRAEIEGYGAQMEAALIKELC